MSRPYVLAEITYKDARDGAYEVAVLPWGATEAHNLHLPYGTDTIESGAVAAEAARRAWERGARVLVLPTVPFGVHTGQRDVPFCLNANPSTQAALLGDIVRSIEPHGVRALVIVNGHGGNDFKQMIRELQPATRVLLCTLNWYAVVKPEPYFDTPGDHGGELESSVMMAVAPELVRPLSEAGDGRARRFRPRGLRDGWAWAQREWTRVTDDTGVGDPRAATREKGKAFLDAVASRVAELFVDLAATPLDEMYE